MEAEEPDPYEGEEGANPFGFSASKPGSSSLAQLFGGGDASAGSLSYEAPKAPAPAAAAPERGATQQPKASILLSLRWGAWSTGNAAEIYQHEHFIAARTWRPVCSP